MAIEENSNKVIIIGFAFVMKEKLNGKENLGKHIEKHFFSTPEEMSCFNSLGFPIT